MGPRLLLLLVLAAGFTVGCGGGSEGDASRDMTAVRQTIHGAVRAALIDRDPRRACTYGTASGRRRMVHWYGLSYERRFRSCEQVVTFETHQPRDPVIARLRENLGVIGPVRIDGARATAQVTDHRGAYPAYVRVVLRKVAGRWLIEDSSAIPRGQ